MKIKQTLVYVAIAAFIVSLLSTGLGGLADMLRNRDSLVISREHAWNDGIYMVLAAIFLLLLTHSL